MKLSVVTSLYYSQDCVEEFYRRITREAEKVTADYEIIFVNDGSPDGSLECALQLYERDRHITVIDLSRNFGQHKAIMTGLAHASGDLVFLLDIDLEEEPELLGNFYARMQASGADVVFGVQKSRKGDWQERQSGELFYRLFNLLSDVRIPQNLVHARLMSNRYVSALLQYREQNIYIAGLWAMTGFKQEAMLIEKHSRGKSSYNLGRKVGLMVNGITSFSLKPLYFIFILGSGLLVLSALAGLYVLLRGMLTGVSLEAGSLLLLSIWFLAGLVIFCLGIIALYLASVVIETKPRPYTLVRQIYTRR